MQTNNIEITIRLPQEEDLTQGKIEKLCDLINHAYQVADEGIWEEWQRIDAQTLKTLLKNKAILIAEINNKIVGCINVNLLNETTAEFSTFAVDNSVQNLGIGEQLMQAAEQWAIDNGRSIAQIEVIYPRHWQHPYKEFVKKWCETHNYKPQYTGPFEKLNSHIVTKLATAKLATPCDFVVYHKKLKRL